jgi:hypothetical protein
MPTMLLEEGKWFFEMHNRTLFVKTAESKMKTSFSSLVYHKLCLYGPTDRLVTTTIWLVLLNAT